MSTSTTSATWFSDLRWWLLLGALLTLGLVSNWAIAMGVLLLLLAHAARPFDFFTAFLLVVGGATFVEYTTGALTLQLGILTCGILVMLMCYAISNAGRISSIPRTALTLPLLCFLALTLANTGRGLLVGYSRKYIGLELLPLLALGSALLVANAFERPRDLRWVVVGLVLAGLAAAFGGFMTFAATRTHSAGYTMATPGIVAVLLINLALRSKTGTASAGLIGLAIPMLLHQFITFGRGLWTGCIAALAVSVLIYAGVGSGSGQRWRKAGLVFGSLLALGFCGALITAQAFDQRDLLSEAGTRLLSSTNTKLSQETRSNLVRLGEYLHAWNLIRESPWVGHGVGYVFPMKQVISLKPGVQWYVHQYFLFVWLKQGLLGLVLFIWLLAAAVKLGVREARRHEDWMESAWFATMAAATVFLAVLSLSNFPFGVVNEMFLLALLWGGAMAMTRKGFVTVRWSPPESVKADAVTGRRLPA